MSSRHRTFLWLILGIAVLVAIDAIMFLTATPPP
jgi:hypothetical protein